MGLFERVCIAQIPFLLFLRDTSPAYEIPLNWSNLLGENLSKHKHETRNLAIEFASLNIALPARFIITAFLFGQS